MSVALLKNELSIVKIRGKHTIDEIRNVLRTRDLYPFLKI